MLTVYLCLKQISRQKNQFEKEFFFTVYGTQTQQTQQNSITNTQILVDHCFTKALQTIKVEK